MDVDSKCVVPWECNKPTDALTTNRGPAPCDYWSNAEAESEDDLGRAAYMTRMSSHGQHGVHQHRDDVCWKQLPCCFVSNKGFNHLFCAVTAISARIHTIKDTPRTVATDKNDLVFSCLFDAFSCPCVVTRL